MYRVVAKNTGKYNNVMPGTRYCFTKRTVINLATQFLAVKCECKVEKLVRLHHDIFCWSDAEVGFDVWGKIYEAVGKMLSEGVDENPDL